MYTWIRLVDIVMIPTGVHSPDFSTNTIASWINSNGRVDHLSFGVGNSYGSPRLYYANFGCDANCQGGIDTAVLQVNGSYGSPWTGGSDNAYCVDLKGDTSSTVDLTWINSYGSLLSKHW